MAVIQERMMATKNYCRHVIGEENLVGGWCIQSCQAWLWLSVFMSLLSPAISPKHGSINGSVQSYDNGRDVLGNDYIVCLSYLGRAANLTTFLAVVSHKRGPADWINPSPSFVCDTSLCNGKELYRHLWPPTSSGVHSSVSLSKQNSVVDAP